MSPLQTITIALNYRTIINRTSHNSRSATVMSNHHQELIWKQLV